MRNTGRCHLRKGLKRTLKKKTCHHLADLCHKPSCIRGKQNPLSLSFQWLFFIFAACWLLSFGSLTNAADLEKYFEADPSSPWRINADNMTYDKNTDQTTASGNAIIQKQNVRLTADEVRYNRTSLKGEAQGNVTITSGADALTGERMEMDLSTGTGTLYDGTLFLKEKNYHVSGQKIQKTSENEYSAENVKITTCDGDVPAWSISGQTLDVTLDGYGVVHHAVFRVKDIPLLYTPFFMFPAKSKRQSGLLMPQFGSSDRKGAEYIQPFFWAIYENSDMTLYEHFMGERGNKLGLEYRYVLSEDSRGTLMADGFKDRKVDDGTGSTTADYGYLDGYGLRPNSDRYWFRAKHDQALPFDISAQLDLDILSDQDYLHEFKSGYAGFDDSDANFLKYFGRDLEDYNDPVRTNRLKLNRLWSSVSMNTEVRWLDDVVARRRNTEDETVQRLPEVSVAGARQTLFNMPLFVGFETEYAYFYREDGTRGHRTDVYPRFYLPYRFGNYLSAEPSVGLRETVWHLDKFDDFIGDTDRTMNRETYDFKLDFSSELHRVYPIDTDWADRMKHIMRFQVGYEYVPELSQSKYPEFDEIDRLENRDLIVYSWTHSFVTRSIIQRPEDAKGTGKDLPDYDYHQIARIKFEQSYDIFREDEDLPEPFSPITTEIEFSPWQSISLLADTAWSAYDHKFIAHNVACRLSDTRGDEFYIERRYRKDQLETIYMDVVMQATSWLWVYGNFERNLLDSRDIEKGAGVSFKAGCWSVNIGYAKEDEDEQLLFSISLYGLGEFGSGGRAIGKTPYYERWDRTD
ncbi:MAG: LPS assembly protein LptD [Desulfobacterales bacterium]|jgi:LPS-assembly protein|nr:LPS assembly protein LptD [Desulfobacterales bacterium]